VSERRIGFIDIEGIGLINFIRHGEKETADTDDSVEFSWRASTFAGEVLNRSKRFKNPEDPINDITEIFAADGNPFNSRGEREPSNR